MALWQAIASTLHDGESGVHWRRIVGCRGDETPYVGECEACGEPDYAGCQSDDTVDEG